MTPLTCGHAHCVLGFWVFHMFKYGQLTLTKKIALIKTLIVKMIAFIKTLIILFLVEVLLVQKIYKWTQFGYVLVYEVVLFLYPSLLHFVLDLALEFSRSCVCTPTLYSYWMYPLVSLTYFCGHLLDINKIILSFHNHCQFHDRHLLPFLPPLHGIYYVLFLTSCHHQYFGFPTPPS